MDTRVENKILYNSPGGQVSTEKRWIYANLNVQHEIINQVTQKIINVEQ